MPKNQHFDAAGHACHSWIDLLKIIEHKPSQAILRQCMLFQVIVHPYVQIRLRKPFDGAVEVIHYGTGNKSERTEVLSSRQTEALRRFFLRANKSGWLVENGIKFVTFTRLARVTRDPLRRFSGGV